LKKNISKIQRKIAGIKESEFKSWVGDKEFIALPTAYNYMLATALKKCVKDIKNQVLSSEHVILVTGKIISVFYKRDIVENLWILNVVIRGGYKDERFKG